MKQTVNEYDFHRAFEALRPDNFSYEGLGLLFEYFEQLEDDMGEEIELDVIAICCDWAEGRASEIVSDFGLNSILDLDDLETDSEEYCTAVEDHVRDQTSVAGITGTGTIVYQSY
jgi:hypothetical protein